jgi:hypothetical protein
VIVNKADASALSRHVSPRQLGRVLAPVHKIAAGRAPGPIADCRGIHESRVRNALFHITNDDVCIVVIKFSHSPKAL